MTISHEFRSRRPRLHPRTATEICDGHHIFRFFAGQDRAAFNCGNESLDRYIRAQASQDTRRAVARVFVATMPVFLALPRTN